MNNYLWKCFLQYFYNTTQGQNVLNFFHIFFPLTSKATLTCSFLRIQNRSFQFRINKLFKNIWFFMLDQCRQLYPFNPIRTGLLGGIKSREGGGYKKPHLWKPSADCQNALKLGLSNIWDISSCLKLLWLILCHKYA